MCTHLGVDPAPSPEAVEATPQLSSRPGSGFQHARDNSGLEWRSVPRDKSTLGETLGWPRIVRATSTARGLSFKVDFCPPWQPSALASRRELGDKVRLLELRHSAENLPNQNSCRRVVEDALGLSTAISSTPSPYKNPKPVSCTMRSRAKREASCGRRCLRSPSASRRTLALSDRIRPHLQVGVSGTMSKQQCSTIPKRDLLKL